MRGSRETVLWAFVVAALVLVMGVGPVAQAAGSTPFPRAGKAGLPGLRIISTMNAVTSLAVDSQYVWVGSTGGLAAIDKATGARYRMTSAEGLPGNVVTSVLRVGEAVWVTTETGVTTWHIGGTARRWDVLLTSSLPLVDAGPVVSDGKAVCVGDRSSWATLFGAAAWTGKGWQAVPLPGEGEGDTPHASVDLLTMRDGVLWLGLDQGSEPAKSAPTVASYDLRKRKWRQYSAANGLPEAPLVAGVATAAGLWVLTAEKGLAHFDGQRWTRQQPKALQGANAAALIAGPDGTLWIGTDRGLLRGSGAPLSWESVAGSPRDITAVVADGDAVWCGTAHDGVWRRDGYGAWRQYRDTDGPLDDGDGLVAFSRQQACFGGPSGLSLLDLATGKWRYLTAAEGLAPGGIKSLAVDGDTLWYVASPPPVGEGARRATLGSVDLCTGRPTALRVPGVDIVAVAKPGLLVALRDRQVQTFDPAQGKWRRVSRAPVCGPNDDPPVLTAAWPRAWYGVSADTRSGGLTSSGSALVEVDLTTGASHQLTHIDMGYGVNSITRAGNALWVTAYGGQPEVMTTTIGRPKVRPVADTAAAWVTSSAWLGRYLWLGTCEYEGERSGLVRYDPATHQNHTYTTRDGLPSLDTDMLAVHGSELWVVTRGGVAVFSAVGGH
jgi:hypothetical protein